MRRVLYWFNSTNFQWQMLSVLVSGLLSVLLIAQELTAQPSLETCAFNCILCTLTVKKPLLKHYRSTSILIQNAADGLLICCTWTMRLCRSFEPRRQRCATCWISNFVLSVLPATNARAYLRLYWKVELENTEKVLLGHISLNTSVDFSHVTKLPKVKH